MKRTIVQLASLLGKLCNLLSRVSLAIAAGLVVIMALMVGIGALSRYTVARPVPLVDELGAYMLVAITFIGAGYVLRQGGHVKVDFVIRMLSPRAAAWLTVVTDLMSILGTIMLTVMTAQVVMLSLRVGSRTTGPLEISIGSVQLLMPIGLSILLLQFLYVLSTSLKSALRQQEIHE